MPVAKGQGAWFPFLSFPDNSGFVWSPEPQVRCNRRVKEIKIGQGCATEIQIAANMRESHDGFIGA
jgi:hypothetical protein